MDETEKVAERPKCRYKVADPAGSRPCGSEDDIHIVKGRSKTMNRPMETPVCSPHRIDVIKNWNWDDIRRPEK